MDLGSPVILYITSDCYFGLKKSALLELFLSLLYILHYYIPLLCLFDSLCIHPCDPYPLPSPRFHLPSPDKLG